MKASEKSKNLKKGAFTKEEDEIILKNVEEFKKNEKKEFIWSKLEKILNRQNVSRRYNQLLSKK